MYGSEGRTWRQRRVLTRLKLHIGVDCQKGLVHSASVTSGNVHDSQELPNLLHGEERRLYGDSAYRGKEQRKRLKAIAPKAKDFTNKHTRTGRLPRRIGKPIAASPRCAPRSSIRF